LQFRRWLVVVNKPIINLSEDVEYKRARTFIGSIVFGTAIVTIYDLRGDRVCDRSIAGVSCMMYWSFMLTRRSHDPIYSCTADVGFKAALGGTPSFEVANIRRVVLYSTYTFIPIVY
jgi:hypothetical protein